jgi:hypothetical protein
MAGMAVQLTFQGKLLNRHQLRAFSSEVNTGRVKKTRQNKKIERGRYSIQSERALASAGLFALHRSLTGDRNTCSFSHQRGIVLTK